MIVATPKRTMIATAGQETSVAHLYSSIDKGFDVSIVGDFTGTLILLIDHGDGVWCVLKKYTAPIEDHGVLSNAHIKIKVSASEDFSGTAQVLIVQDSSFFDQEFMEG